MHTTGHLRSHVLSAISIIRVSQSGRPNLSTSKVHFSGLKSASPGICFDGESKGASGLDLGLDNGPKVQMEVALRIISCQFLLSPPLPFLSRFNEPSKMTTSDSDRKSFDVEQ